MSTPSCLLGEIGKLISDEAKDSIDRMIVLAHGELLPAADASVNAHRPTPIADSALPNTEHRTPSTTVYLRSPRLFPIEFIMNFVLGPVGAEIDYYETTPDASEKLQGARCREAGIDHADLLTACEQQLIDALPTAIDRLFELAAGITIQRTRYGKPYTVTCKPDCKAIELIAERVAGKSTSVIGELRTKFENPDTEREYTPEDIAAMTQAERIVLRDALLRKQESDSKQTNQTPTRYPSPIYGRRVGDEGSKVGGNVVNTQSDSSDSPFPARYERIGEGGRGVRQTQSSTMDVTVAAAEEASSALPVHILTANNRLTDFLPAAIGHMKTLACGAQTIIETETERKIFNHEPDARANAFLINRFMGKPSNFMMIEKIVEKTEYEKNIEYLTARYPQAVERYGSIEAALAAHAALTK